MHSLNTNYKKSKNTQKPKDNYIIVVMIIFRLNICVYSEHAETDGTPITSTLIIYNSYNKKRMVSNRMASFDISCSVSPSLFWWC